MKASAGRESEWGALLGQPLVLLHRGETKQFAAATELQEQQEIVGSVEGEVESDNEIVRVLLQNTVLGKDALDLSGDATA